MGIKLSIAIPTYNGAATIRETLDSIVSQLEDSVEIVISDNASTDETAEIVREYQARYPVIRYFHNEENLGADRNIDLAVRRSQGEYVWLFSDDDKMVTGGVRKVLDVLRDHHDLSAIFVNWGSYSSDFTQSYKKQVLDIKKDLYCRDSNSFLSAVKLNPIFISANVVRRSYWTKSNLTRYVGSNWLQYGALLTILPSHSAYCISTPYVMYRSGMSGWKQHHLVHIKNGVMLATILHGLSGDNYSRSSVQQALNVIIHSLPPMILRVKSHGLSVNKTLLKEMVSQFRSSPSFWIIDIPLLLLPFGVYRLMRKIWKIPLINRTYKKSKRWIQEKFARV